MGEPAGDAGRVNREPRDGNRDGGQDQRREQTGVTPGLRRFWRDSALEILALLGGAAIWEALGWSLRLQWLPPFLR